MVGVVIRLIGGRGEVVGDIAVAVHAMVALPCVVVFVIVGVGVTRRK